MDRRYFYAVDESGSMVAYIVFCAFPWKERIYGRYDPSWKESTRRCYGTDHVEAFQVFKEEGVEYASLGVAPLAGLKEENASLMEKLLEFVY